MQKYAILIQNAFDCMISRCRRCQNAAGHFFPVNNDINKLALNLVDICLGNSVQILGVPEKVKLLFDHKTKGFCSIIIFLFQ